MKVLLVTESFPPMQHSIADYTQQLALELARDPHVSVAVLTSQAAACPASSEHFVIFPILKTWDWREFKAIFNVIRTWAPDLVHVQYPIQGYQDNALPWLLPICVRLSGIPVVQTWHYPREYMHLFFRNYPFGFLSLAAAPGGLFVVDASYMKRVPTLLRWAFFHKSVRFIPSAPVISHVALSATERVELRAKYARPSAKMVLYFGFIYPGKGVELLFQIADAQNSHLVIIGEMPRETDFPKRARSALRECNKTVRELAESDRWKEKVTMTGFRPAREAACLMAAADAIVLPYSDGARKWRTSLQAAQAQGTFVLTTSNEFHGYDPEFNTYFASPRDLNDMKRALRQYIGKRCERRNDSARAWQSLREAHIELYQTQVG